MNIENISAVVPRLRRIQNVALGIGLIGAVLLAVGAYLTPQEFFRAYLMAYFFWIGVSLGCLALALLHDISGGMWGALILRFVEAGMSTLPLMLLLYVPLLFGLGEIYRWAQPAQVAQDSILQHQSPYLNQPFFVGRTAFYFLTWIVAAFLARRWSLARDHAANPAEFTARLRRLGAAGLLLFALTSSFAAIDWVMSLEPDWWSTIYAAMIVVGGILAAFALVIVFIAVLDDREPLAGLLSKQLFNDLGSLLLMFVILWTYLAFSQFLLIYSGNGAREITWYVHRLQGGWQWVGLAVAALDFFLPFILLISRDIKRRPRVLGTIAGFLVFARLVEVFWLVMPAFHPDGFYFQWLDIVAPLAIGGLWIAVFTWNLKGQPLVPLHDRHFIESAKAELARETRQFQSGQ
jgi:hypothetical protein